MASLFDQFATSRKMEVEGILIDIGGGTRFRIARRSKTNKRYTKVLEAATKPYQTAIEKETLSPEVGEAIMLDVFCSTLLLDWEGVQYDPRMGTLSPEPELGIVPFSLFNAKVLMTALPELYDELSKQAGRMSNFRDAEDEADAKN